MLHKKNLGVKKSQVIKRETKTTRKTRTVYKSTDVSRMLLQCSRNSIETNKKKRRQVNLLNSTRHPIYSLVAHACQLLLVTICNQFATDLLPIRIRFELVRRCLWTPTVRRTVCCNFFANDLYNKTNNKLTKANSLTRLMDLMDCQRCLQTGRHRKGFC